MESDNFEVVVIPSFGISVMSVEMEMARLVASRIPVVVLIANVSEWDDEAMKDEPGVTLIRLPPLPEVPAVAFPPLAIATQMEAYTPVVLEIIQKRFSSSGRTLAGFVMNLFCTAMAAVADELGVPSYLMLASAASTLSFYFHFDAPLGGQLPTSPMALLEVPGFRNPLPEKAWPAVLKNKKAASLVVKHINRIRKFKGVLLDTFEELEPELIASLSQNTMLPPVFPIGPVIDPGKQERRNDALIDWLDAQPLRSVVFLSFGSLGAFSDDQVREVAVGLEKSGHRFLWSLRQQCGPWEGRDYDDFNEVLPEGFLARTSGLGRVVSCVPQREVLAHPSTGAFVSHCICDSMLESLFFGVPVAAWPLFAEQHLNAYYWSREAGLAAEITMDSLYDATLSEAGYLVDAAHVELGIRRAMEDESLKKRVAKMSLVARKALLHGGSSHRSLTLFTNHIIRNISSIYSP